MVKRWRGGRGVATFAHGGDGCYKLVGLASGSVYRKQMGYACSAPYFTGIYCLLFRRLRDDIEPCLLVVALMSLIAPPVSDPSRANHRLPANPKNKFLISSSRSSFNCSRARKFGFLSFFHLLTSITSINRNQDV